MSPSPLSPEALAKALADLPEWAVVDGKLHRELRFPDFVAAFGFMTSVALVAEKRDHHPEWSNVYGRVVVDLTTHDAGGITEKDLDLARTIDQLAG
jgi:4a-hydroxytetrahydrobiopterin dehydratase